MDLVVVLDNSASDQPEDFSAMQELVLQMIDELPLSADIIR